MTASLLSWAPEDVLALHSGATTDNEGEMSDEGNADKKESRSAAETAIHSPETQATEPGAAVNLDRETRKRKPVERFSPDLPCTLNKRPAAPRRGNTTAVPVPRERRPKDPARVEKAPRVLRPVIDRATERGLPCAPRLRCQAVGKDDSSCSQTQASTSACARRCR